MAAEVRGGAELTPDSPRRPRRRRGLLAALLAAGLLLAALAVLASGALISERRGAGVLPDPAALGCDGPLGTADLAALLPGAAPIPCEPWDIGTGVQGYVWHAPRPRAALLLQHGFGEYAQRYLRQHDRLIPHLLAAGITVYAFDLWGHGHSPGTRAATDLRAAVADHLAARCLIAAEGRPVFVLGHSLGAFVTASSIARDPDGLAGAIILSPPFPEEGNPLARGALNALATLAPGGRAPLPSVDPATSSRLPEQIAEALADPLNYHGDMTNLTAATTLAVAREDWPLFRGWTVPTLILHGAADARVDPEGSRRLFAAIAAEDKTLRLVEGARHALLNDADRDEVLALILAWLEARLPPRG